MESHQRSSQCSKYTHTHTHNPPPKKRVVSERALILENQHQARTKKQNTKQQQNWNAYMPLLCPMNYSGKSATINTLRKSYNRPFFSLFLFFFASTIAWETFLEKNLPPFPCKNFVVKQSHPSEEKSKDESYSKEVFTTPLLISTTIISNCF